MCECKYRVRLAKPSAMYAWVLFEVVVRAAGVNPCDGCTQYRDLCVPGGPPQSPVLTPAPTWQILRWTSPAANRNRIDVHPVLPDSVSVGSAAKCVVSGRMPAPDGVVEARRPIPAGDVIAFHKYMLFN